MVAQRLRPSTRTRQVRTDPSRHVNAALFAGELRQFAQRWLQHVLHIKARLVARPSQPAEGPRRQSPSSRCTMYPACASVRARRSTVVLCRTAAPAQLGQRQARFPSPKASSSCSARVTAITPPSAVVGSLQGWLARPAPRRSIGESRVLMEGGPWWFWWKWVHSAQRYCMVKRFPKVPSALS